MQGGPTCLHLAAKHNNVEVVQFLVEAGGQELLWATNDVSHF
jgi:hypothetical protein